MAACPQDRSERAALDGAVLGDDHGPAIRMPVDGVAALGTDVGETEGFEDTVTLRTGRSDSAGLTRRRVPGMT